MQLTELDDEIERLQARLEKLTGIRDALADLGGEQHRPAKRGPKGKPKKFARVSSASRPPKAGAKAGQSLGKRAAKRAELLERLRPLVAKDPDLSISEAQRALGKVGYLTAKTLLAELK